MRGSGYSSRFVCQSRSDLLKYTILALEIDLISNTPMFYLIYILQKFDNCSTECASDTTILLQIQNSAHSTVLAT